jgi:N-glycosylase/DNA lyase|tara:strand:- start:334 stop:567 length:234 start_codon:yes stop_codon:yes gene_type:complete
MKEVKLIEMKKKIDALTNIVKHLLQEVNMNTTLAKGTLTAFQLHIGEDEWSKLVEELKNKELRDIEQEKKLDLDGVE